MTPLRDQWAALRLCWILATLTLLGMPSSAARAASFDCAKASSRVEKLICSDSELSQMDEAMAAAYGALDKSANLRRDQREWVKWRNACSAAECVRATYQSRLAALMGAALAASPSKWTPGRQRFELVRGAGVEVCEAYVEMLRRIDFVKPPYCDRPEPVGVPGFEPLRRVRLPVEVQVDIGMAIPALMRGEKDPAKYLGAADASSVEWDIARASQKVPIETEPSAFDPPLDVDNDGRPDRVAYFPERMILCGEQTEMNKDGSLLAVQRHAVALDERGRIDVARTRAWFAHPVPYVVTYKDSVSRKPITVTTADFRPLAGMTTFTRFRGRTYFDGFMDWMGDLEGAHRFDPALNTTLAVYENDHGKIHQRCEIKWFDRVTR